MALLNEFMSGGEKKLKVHVSEIRRNERNFYAVVSENEEENVDNLATILREDGQDDNGVVYEDTSLNDGKKYTLLAGERRWKAITKNYENGLGDGMYEVKVVRRPADEIDELMRIVRNNAQRNKTKEVRAAEVKAMEVIWDGLVARGEKPEGKKRDWIGANIGLSPRRVQEYMTGEESDIGNDEANPEEGGNSATSNNSSSYGTNQPQSIPSQSQNQQSTAPAQPQKPSNRQFLFSDGYTMDTVSGACSSALFSSGYAGSCVPLQDANGIYYGMELRFY